MSVTAAMICSSWSTVVYCVQHSDIIQICKQMLVMFTSMFSPYDLYLMGYSRVQSSDAVQDCQQMYECSCCRAASIEWFAEECRRVNGDVLQTVSGSSRPVVIKQPVGVVGAITPWNFPMSMITRKVSPAISVGCPVRTPAI